MESKINLCSLNQSKTAHYRELKEILSMVKAILYLIVQHIELKDEGDNLTFWIFQTVLNQLGNLLELALDESRLKLALMGPSGKERNVQTITLFGLTNSIHQLQSLCILSVDYLQDRMSPEQTNSLYLVTEHLKRAIYLAETLALV